MPNESRSPVGNKLDFASYVSLFLASVVVIYFELLAIRYLSEEVRVFDSLKNLPLVACFLGTALGMVSEKFFPRLRAWFPAIACHFFLAIRYAFLVGGRAFDLSWNYGLQFASHRWSPVWSLGYLAIVLVFLAAIVGQFMVLGGIVGERLSPAPALPGYAVNLGGSLAGALLFSCLSALNLSPGVWLLVGFSLLLAVAFRKTIPILTFVVLVVLVALPEPHVFWSPYYKIEFSEVPRPAGWPRPSGYTLIANHLWYQYMADLSPEFLKQNETAQPNRAMVPYYDLPYKLVPHPRNVLILGSGTGNDVAGALRHGAEHIDAVELDPVIYRLGKEFHPEQPYASARVTSHIGDARAFLGKSQSRYDLIVFGFLDSHTLLSSFSSLRVDNYVYTEQSFEEAKALLSPDGTLVVSFATSRSFPTERLYATLEKAFGTPPSAFLTEYWVKGTILIEGAARTQKLNPLTEVTNELRDRATSAIVATDNWPFLYLEDRSIPTPVWVVSIFFLLAAWILIRRVCRPAWRQTPASWHFFLLGAGFLLLETTAVTRMSLLFGSTWMVNAIVISSFLVTSLLSAILVLRFSIPARYGYVLLFLILLANLWFPWHALNRMDAVAKVFLGGGWAALPVLLSGIVFSSSLRKFGGVTNVLGINLFGAVVGGILENVVMIGGTSVLAVLALALYGLSAVCLWSRSREGPQIAPLRTLDRVVDGS